MTRQLAKVIADSISPYGVRLTTLEIEIPRIVLAEFNTHRVLSRNSASSRAIPIEKMLAKVERDPYIPERWGSNGKGMQAHGDVDSATAALALDAWLRARDKAVASARELYELGIHKQTTNRLLEPFLWHTVIVTATEWANFLHLRNHPAAHPAIARTAAAMGDALAASKPTPKGFNEWHLPYVDERDVELTTSEKVKVSCARCARVSYLTHDGRRDVAEDLGLYDKLIGPGHMSPFEHAARPASVHDVTKLNPTKPALDAFADECAVGFFGNFRGWVQHRKTIPGEFDILGYRKAQGQEPTT